jgi:hypothetical protein
MVGREQVMGEKPLEAILETYVPSYRDMVTKKT